MPTVDLTPEQISQEGERLYAEKLKTVLEPEHVGKFVVIDVASGDYFLGETILKAAEQARAKYNDRIFYTKRIGYPGIFRLGLLRLKYGWTA